MKVAIYDLLLAFVILPMAVLAVVIGWGALFRRSRRMR